MIGSMLFGLFQSGDVAGERGSTESEPTIVMTSASGTAVEVSETLSSDAINQLASDAALLEASETRAAAGIA